MPAAMTTPVDQRVARLPSSAFAGTSVPPVLDAVATQPVRDNGADTTPVNATFVAVPLSLPVMTQTSLNVPPVVDVNFTLSVSVWPAGSAEPSLSVVVATNWPSAGGFDFTICRSVPPVFWIVKLFVTETPELVVPKSIDSGVMTMCGAVPEAPVSGIVRLPPLLLTTRLPEKLPAVVGEKVTVAVTFAPAASVAPLAGTPVTEKGAAGSVDVAKVSVCVPVFWRRIEICFVVPVTMPPNATVAGVMLSCAAFTTPVPLSAMVPPPPPLIATLIEPVTGPDAVGLKVTGTVSDWPEVSVAGSAGVDVPSVYVLGEIVRPPAGIVRF